MTTNGDLQIKLKAFDYAYWCRRGALAAELDAQAQVLAEDRAAQFKALDDAYYAMRRDLIASKDVAQ